MEQKRQDFLIRGHKDLEKDLVEVKKEVKVVQVVEVVKLVQVDQEKSKNHRDNSLVIILS